MKINPINSSVNALLFIICIFGFGIINIHRLGFSVINYLSNANYQNNENISEKLEEMYRNSFSYRNEFLDFFGIVQNAMGKNVVGNFEFIKDNQGYMHKVSGQQSIENFSENLKILKAKLEYLHTPLIYVQNPSKEIEGFTSFSNKSIINGNVIIDELLNRLKKEKINFIDVRQKVKEQNFPSEDLFFKTDIHMKTEAEFWITKTIIYELEHKYGLLFNNKNQILNLENYTVIAKPFWGNYCRSVGRYYTAEDVFITYIPNFKTDLTLINNSKDIQKRGTFEEVILNGDEKNPNNGDNIYWVTNFLQFPSPYYQIINNNVEKNSILLIMDSMGIRSAAYLSLLAHKITIIDPRFQKENDMFVIDSVYKEKFDAVIVLQGEQETLLGFDIFPNMLINPKSQILFSDAPMTMENGKKYNFSVIIKNTGEGNWDNMHKISFGYIRDGVYDDRYRIYLDENAQIKPGDEYKVNIVNFLAPDDFQKLEFGMLQEEIQWFGEKVQVLQSTK